MDTESHSSPNTSINDSIQPTLSSIADLFSALFRDRCINVPYSYLRGGIMA